MKRFVNDGRLSSLTPPLGSPDMEKTDVHKYAEETPTETLSVEDVHNIIKRVKTQGEQFMSNKKAIKFGIVGLGQGGGRLASEFEKLGYPAIAVNTSVQDLDGLTCKERVQIGDGGAGRDLKNGESAVLTNKTKLMDAYRAVFPGIQHALVCAGSSGGTGGGGVVAVVESLLSFKVPVGVITTLPLNTEDSKSKRNTLTVLNKLVKMAAERKISPLIIIDNDKIEKKYPGLSTLEFWQRANADVVKCFDLFNMFAYMSSPFTSFDPADYKMVLNSGGCMIFGNITVTGPITSETFEVAIRQNLNSGLLAEGFNLVEATHAACIVVSNMEKLKEVSRNTEENGFAELVRQLGSGTVYRGVYALPQVKDIELFFMISGLGLPVARIKELIESSKQDSSHFFAKKEATVRTIDDIMRDIGETNE